ncbi:MAG: serine hydrolase [Pseudomonadota bacterium]
MLSNVFEQPTSARWPRARAGSQWLVRVLHVWLGCLVCVWLIAGCSRTPVPDASQIVATAPEAIDDGWETAALSDEGIDSDVIRDMLVRIQSGQYEGVSSVLLASGGKLVLEAYFGDWARDDLHSTRSAAKAITSVLVGIAIDQGFIGSADDLVLPFFPEYDGETDNWDSRKGEITLAHILSMTSGVRGNEDAMYPESDWIKFYLDQPLVADPGTKFSYATSGVVTLGNVITRASDLRIPAFTDKYLFGPLGITEYRWPITNSKGNQGLAMTGGGLNLRPRDMLKFGQLMLNDGVWNGERIVSSEWIEVSTRKHATSDLHGEDFGYLWRMIDREVSGHAIRSFEAWGNGGQFIMVFPTIDLVAVFTGENYGQFPEMERPFELIDRFILPAVVSDRRRTLRSE